jgi:hypothetical protein
MQRSILNIAFAAASVLAAASVQAAGFPASGEFSAADEVQTPTVVTTVRSDVRDATRAERAASLRVNGETGQTTAMAPTAKTRQEVRKEGNDALRAHKLPAGEASI